MSNLNGVDMQREAVAGSVPVGVVTANHIFGIPLNDVILWLTLAYIVFQIVVISPKLYSTLNGYWEALRGKQNVNKE